MMRRICLLALYIFFMCLAPFQCESFLETIAHWVNKRNSTWKADSRMDRGSLLAPFWALPGTRAADPYRFFMSVKRFDSIDRSSIPQEFDARKQWPYCPTLYEVFEQGKCASCWAVAPADVMSDRICIHSQGRHIVRLSPGNLLACCRFCGRGCDGGYPGAAWLHWRRNGIVTGSSFFSEYGCQRYQYYSCSRIGSFSKNCLSEGPKPKCTHVCQSSYERTYDQDLYYGESVYRVPKNVEAIQMEIMTHGPVQTVLRVYDDFLSYREGIYQHIKGKAREYHAVKILGWGEEGGVPYWLAVNTWSRRWGMGGFFKILRGSNHIEIETHVMAGIPLLDSADIRENEINLPKFSPGMKNIF